MRGKIVLGVYSSIAVVSVILTFLLINVTPVHLNRQTFSAQINEPLVEDLSHYIKASPTVLEECTLHVDEVDTSIIAVYPAYIMYKDQRFDFQIMIEDKKKPIIELKSESAIVSCYIGRTFTAAELVNIQDDTSTTVYFVDKKGENQTERITLKKEGTFEYFIMAKDSADNYSTKIRIRFEVGIDTSKPVITGIDDVTLKVDDTFDVMAGVKATDNADGDVTSMIVVSPSSISTSKPGQFTITYTVTDLSGNKTVETRLITVTGTAGQVDVGNGAFLTEDEVNQRDAIVKSLLNKELNAWDDKTFLRSLNTYLMNNFKRSSNDDTSYDVIVRQRGTRMAMVRAVKVILDARGIENTIVYGKSDGMVWNLVRVDNDYRHIDVYTNAIYNNADHCFLLKTSELGDVYAYDTTLYPNAD